MREQWKESPRERTDERIDCDGAVGVEAVAVDEVAHTLPEGYHAAKTEESDRKHLWYPSDVWVASPGKPKETNRQRDGPNNHRW